MYSVYVLNFTVNVSSFVVACTSQYSATSTKDHNKMYMYMYVYIYNIIITIKYFLHILVLSKTEYAAFISECFSMIHVDMTHMTYIHVHVRTHFYMCVHISTCVILMQVSCSFLVGVAPHPLCLC